MLIGGLEPIGLQCVVIRCADVGILNSVNTSRSRCGCTGCGTAQFWQGDFELELVIRGGEINRYGPDDLIYPIGLDNGHDVGRGWRCDQTTIVAPVVQVGLIGRCRPLGREGNTLENMLRQLQCSGGKLCRCTVGNGGDELIAVGVRQHSGLGGGGCGPGKKLIHLKR